MDPIDAELALAEVRIRRDQVVSSTLVPTWFWLAIGALMLLFVASIESRIPWLIATGSALYGLGLAAAIGVVAFRSRVQVRNALLGLRGAVAITVFALTLVAIGLGLGFALEALGAPHPATIAMAPVALGTAFGGPRLMAYLRRLMLSRPLAGAR
ncbi:hypothetical protein [Paractinoplanes atraurantiacus]|uniref:Uncharacterized protein n=1 Tax=Paractinoplanes atraurantiacus TaxID=1036182 RepID=A0A285I4K3_9ACTN|nr:hypothetical protein [Actinoplanes atraurantiacus]SNY42879.1 hypothetical protein SAMN05421748_106345 [Actinoplanes atraurantiacus]